MTRKKVKLAFIVNASARKAAYKKRKNSLLKQVDELSTLCGINACAIVYSPYDPQPEVWPSPRGVENVISKFWMMPELEQSKKMVDQESFLKQRILKVEDQLKKQRMRNNEKEMTLFMFQCLAAGKIVNDNMSMADLNELGWLIDRNLNDIGRRMESLDMNAQVVAPSQVHVAAPVLAAEPTMANNEERALMDQALGLGFNVDNMQRLMSNDNRDETISFGYDNLPLGYLPNQIP